LKSGSFASWETRIDRLGGGWAGRSGGQIWAPDSSGAVSKVPRGVEKKFVRKGDVVP